MFKVHNERGILHLLKIVAEKKGSAAQVTQEIIVCIFKLHTWNFFYSFEI